MLATRAAKPKLSLTISTAVQSSSRPCLSLQSPMTASHNPPRTPVSPSPCSPTARNTRLNQRGYSIRQQPTFAYANTSTQRSILKKGSPSSNVGSRQLQFRDEPTVYSITPIESGEEYYGSYAKMTRDERRWSRR